MKVNMKTREIVYCAIFATITAVLAQISIPLPGGVPLTMQTFAVSLAGILLGSKRGFISMLVYVLMGCIGIPVFAGLTAGIGAVLGPTGGFILSFPIMSFIIGLITERTNNKIIIFLGMVLGSIVNYVVGAAQFAIVTDSTLGDIKISNVYSGYGTTGSYKSMDVELTCPRCHYTFKSTVSKNSNIY